MENLRNRIDVRQVNNKKGYSKWTLKPSFITKKIFNHYLLAIHKIKTTLTLIKLAHGGMCTLELSKVPMYELPQVPLWLYKK